MESSRGGSRPDYLQVSLNPLADGMVTTARWFIHQVEELSKIAADHSVADMRSRLVVTEALKPTMLKDGMPNKFYVVKFEGQPMVVIREGAAGSMYDYKNGQTLPCNAQQMNFVDKSPYTNPELFKFDFSAIKEIK